MSLGDGDSQNQVRRVLDQIDAQVKCDLGRDYATAGAEIDALLRERRSDLYNVAGLRSDGPTCDDALGFKLWVDSEVALLTDLQFETPAFVCIEGPWGSGKSSFLEMIANRLKPEQGWLPVTIDTSEFLGASEVIPYVFEQVREAGVHFAQAVLQNPQSTPCFGGKVSEAMLKAAVKDSGDWLTRWADGTPYGGQIASLVQIVRHIRHGLLGRQGFGRVFLLIDDLDRCDAEVIMQVLRVHRAFLNEPGVVMLYAMDFNVVAHLIGEYVAPKSITSGQNQNQAWIWGQRYLEKFFGQRLRAPEPSPEQLRHWLEMLLANNNVPEYLSETMWWGLQANPRRIKYYANMCGNLNRIASRLSAGDSSPWVGIREIKEDLQGYICKTLGLIQAWPSVYQYVRSAGPEALKGVEQAAMAGMPIPRMQWGNLVSEAPNVGLIALLSGEPLFQKASLPVLKELMELCEPFRGLATYRYSEVHSVEPIYSAPHAPSGQGEVRQVRPNDTRRLSETLARWAQTVNLSEKLRTVLRDPLPLTQTVDLFTDHDFKPPVSLLLKEGLLALAEGRLELGWFLMAVICVHPDADDDDFDTIDTVLREMDQFELQVEVMTVAVERERDPDIRQKFRMFRLIAMARTGDPKLTTAACDEALAMLPLTINPDGTWTLPEDVAMDLFLSVTDVLFGADDHVRNLRLCRAAAGTKWGLQSSSVIRNLGRALVALGDRHMANRAYRVAMALSPTEELALRWYIKRLTASEAEQELLAYKTLVNRRRHSAEYWVKVGILLHNRGQQIQARPWLERAVQLEPDNSAIRAALTKNVQHLEGMSRARMIVESKDYVPEPDYEPCLVEARSAEIRLLRALFVEGKVEDGGIVLFDANRPPEWILQTYPDLFGDSETH